MVLFLLLSTHLCNFRRNSLHTGVKAEFLNFISIQKPPVLILLSLCHSNLKPALPTRGMNEMVDSMEAAVGVLITVVAIFNFRGM